MSKWKQGLRRLRVLIIMAVFVLALSLNFVSPKVYAAQLSNRSISLSTSTASATASYLVSFTPVTTGAQSLVIDFCSNSSIIGGSCTAPTGFSAASAGFTAGTGTTGWIIGTAAASQLKINKGGGANLGTTAVTFTLTGVTNPSSFGVFYARIYTYSNTTYGTPIAYSSPTAIGSYVDYGGFALESLSIISVSISEVLIFCVSGNAPAANCGSTSAPSITLGHGSPPLLDYTAIDTATAYTQLSTNAQSGVSVRLFTNNPCSGLSADSGVTCGIPGKGAFGAVSAGTAFFGLNVANGSGGVGSVTANSNYGTTAGNYGMGNNVFSSSFSGGVATFGDTIEGSTGPCQSVNSTLTFAATTSSATPTGIYTATESLIATGTF